jgi:hypothetical protein
VTIGLSTATDYRKPAAPGPGEGERAGEKKEGEFGKDRDSRDISIKKVYCLTSGYPAWG